MRAPWLAMPLVLWALPAAAQAGGGDAGAPAEVWASCSEYVPDGATRPDIAASLPDRTFSGYAVELSVTVTHGPGETVMPDGFRIQRGSEAMEALRDAGWEIPEPDGGAAPVVEAPVEQGKTTVTKVRIPFVPLPQAPGRHLMELPPMPISVARANGQVMTLCTPALQTTVEDPIANEVDPQVKPNPPPRPQREEWSQAKTVAFGGLIAIALAILIAYLIARYRARPKVEPAKPKVLPWIAALRDLDDIKRSTLLEEHQYDAYFDRVDHTTRTYLGDRYGFDGLESTSEEIKRYLSRVYPPIKDIDRIRQFLETGDFMKYAEVTPTRDDCNDAMARAEAIVRSTTPPNAKGADRDEEAPKRRRKRSKAA